MTSTILITGATGKVGSRLVELLAGRPGLRALAHSDRSAALLAEDGLDVRRGALDDRAALDAALAGVDALFLLSPYTPDQGTVERGVLDAAAAAGVTRVVKLSSLLTGRDLPIMAGHEAVTRALAASAFPEWTVLEPDNFMDNEVAAIDTIRGGSLFNNAGDARLSFVDARDIAAVAAAELTAEQPAGGHLVITGAEALTYGELAARYGAVLGVELAHVPLSDEAMEGALGQAGLPGFYARDLTGMFASIRESGLSHAPTDTVRRVAGRAPHTPEDFARDVLAPLLQPA